MNVTSHSDRDEATEGATRNYRSSCTPALCQGVASELGVAAGGRVVALAGEFNGRRVVLVLAAGVAGSVPL